VSAWALGALLTGALVVGFASGWLLLARFEIRSPNVWASALILLAGSLGGPALTHSTFGGGALSFAAALFVAGFSTGAVFWPMSLPQGVRQRL
jgi:hypothetical protein